MSLRQTKGAPVALGIRSGAAAKVCFAPIWYPLDNYATSRLRAKHVAELFAGEQQRDVRIGYAADADIVVVVQLCSHSNLKSIQSNRRQFVVYDICDRFYETDNIFPTDEGPLHAQARCLEVIERADALIAPSQRLREELSKRFPQKPCIYVPELVDYGTVAHRLSPRASRRVLWFGHITRGNFESARWILDRLRMHEGYTPVVVTNPTTFADKYPAYASFCVPWSPKTLSRELADASLCVVTHAAEESSKSANRFVTATMHGVPTLVSPTPACLDILQAAGYANLAIRTADDLANALNWLSSGERRLAYVSDLQQEISHRHGPEVVRAAYAGLFDMILQGRARAA
ncbi:MAG: hypothetical protein KIS73_07325 [Enhydrobacter sp.]|nr:hypothetical protein [Enhydrobacter sp.]